jgi:hypothetical protein
MSIIVSRYEALNEISSNFDLLSSDSFVKMDIDNLKNSSSVFKS